MSCLAEFWSSGRFRRSRLGRVRRTNAMPATTERRAESRLRRHRRRERMAWRSRRGWWRGTNRASASWARGTNSAEPAPSLAGDQVSRVERPAGIRASARRRAHGESWRSRPPSPKSVKRPIEAKPTGPFGDSGPEIPVQAASSRLRGTQAAARVASHFGRAVARARRDRAEE